jgi:hypothetical protein
MLHSSGKYVVKDTGCNFRSFFPNKTLSLNDGLLIGILKMRLSFV